MLERANLFVSSLKINIIIQPIITMDSEKQHMFNLPDGGETYLIYLSHVFWSTAVCLFICIFICCPNNLFLMGPYCRRPLNVNRKWSLIQSVLSLSLSLFLLSFCWCSALEAPSVDRATWWCGSAGSGETRDSDSAVLIIPGLSVWVDGGLERRGPRCDCVVLV